MSNSSKDLVDELIGTVPGSRFDQVRNYRSVARENIENAYQALFVSADETHVSLTERHVIALFVAGLHNEPLLTAHYSGRLDKYVDNPEHLRNAATQEYKRGKAEGPFGRHAPGSLSVKDHDGSGHLVTVENRNVLGPRLATALEHAHLLTFHPRDASPKALERLLDVGWTVTAIVTISQLVSYLTFQVRVVSGLGHLATKLSQQPVHSQTA